MNRILSTVSIPNAFKLNSNGSHDTFLVNGTGVYDKIDLTIYNRSGKKVYSDTNYRNDWEVRDLNEDMYYYLIVLNKGFKEKSFKGWVLLGDRLD